MIWRSRSLPPSTAPRWRWLRLGNDVQYSYRIGQSPFRRELYQARTDFGCGRLVVPESQLGTSAAAELTLTGDTIDSARALELGIVSRIVPPDRLLDEARDIAARIVRHPMHSIRLNTRLLREAGRLDLPATLELAAAMQAIVQQTQDQYEAVAAAIEKREPHYQGKMSR